MAFIKPLMCSLSLMPDSLLITTIDTSGLHCPMPLLKLKMALRTVATGGSIRLIATDLDGLASRLSHQVTHLRSETERLIGTLAA